MKQIKKALQKALPKNDVIDNIWSIQGCFYGYQIKGVSYPCRMKVVNGIAILLN